VVLIISLGLGSSLWSASKGPLEHGSKETTFPKIASSAKTVPTDAFQQWEAMFRESKILCISLVMYGKGLVAYSFSGGSVERCTHHADNVIQMPQRLANNLSRLE
jgi:hypothetical protein